jgi:hypothetical protein
MDFDPRKPFDIEGQGQAIAGFDPAQPFEVEAPVVAQEPPRQIDPNKPLPVLRPGLADAASGVVDAVTGLIPNLRRSEPAPTTPPEGFGARMREGIAASRGGQQEVAGRGLPPEDRAGPDPYDQRTTLQNLGGAVRRGFEGQVVQPRAAGALNALDRQIRAMDAIDAGGVVDPGDDPMGYATSDAQARAMIRESVRQQIPATMGAFQRSRQTAQAIPSNPRLGQMAGQIDAGEYGAAARTFLSNPAGITSQVIAESAPSILPQLVLGPTSALMGAGRGARMLWNGIGAFLGDNPARGIEILDDVMQQAGVSPDDPDAMLRFIESNPGVIGNAFRRAGFGSMGLALVSGVTAGLARPLSPTGGLRGNVAPIGGNLAASMIGEPSGEAVAQGITYGEIKSPSSVALEAIGGVPMAGVQTLQETIAAARQPQSSPVLLPPVSPSSPPSAPSGLPPAGVAGAPPPPSAPQPGVSSPLVAGPSATEAGATSIPQPSPGDPPAIPLPPMPPAPQTLAQIQTEQNVSSAEAARIRQQQEDAFIDWHDENMPGADVAMAPPGEPIQDGTAMRAELERALAEPEPAAAEVEDQLPDVGNMVPEPAPQTFPTAERVEVPPDPEPAPPPPVGSRRRPARVRTPQDIDAAAAQVAEPTEAQKAAGNYQHGHVSIGGLPIAIETTAGATRSGTAPDGTRWTSTMGADYGRIKRTTGADGDQVDVFLGPDAHEAQKHPVWIIDQRRTDGSGMFDEHKAMVGFPTQEAARAAYLASFSDNLGTDRIGAMTAMKWPQFKRWAQSGDTQKPVAYKGPVIRARKPATRSQRGPLSLLQFLAGKGGLAPDGDLKAMGANTRTIFGVGGPKRLVRGKGLSLDYAREAAEEAGYIPGGSTTRDLLNAIDEELRGNEVFSAFEAGDAYTAAQEERAAVDAERRADAMAEVRAVAADLGIRPPLTEAEVAEATRLVIEGEDVNEAIAIVLSRDTNEAAQEAPSGEVDAADDIPFDLDPREQSDEAADGPSRTGEDTSRESADRTQPVGGAEDAVPGPGVEGRDGGDRDGATDGEPGADDAGGRAAADEGEADGGVAPLQTELVDTLDGEREQTLIPGVAPITDADREAARPAPERPTQQPPGGMFGPVGQTDLVDATSATYGNLAGPNEAALTEAFIRRIAERGDFPSMQRAMRYASQLLGGPVLPGSRAAATVESALQAARSDDVPFSRVGPASPQAAALAAGTRNQQRRGDVRRGAEAIIDRLRMQQNLDRAAGRRQARNGQAGLRSVTDTDAIREVDAFIQWLGEHMVRDVGLRMSQQRVGAYGQFEVSQRIVTIFRSAIDADRLDRTMVHEMWHAMEAALPPADREAVRQEYLRARDAWLGKNEWARTFLSGDQLLDQITGDEAQAWLAEHPNRAGIPVVVDRPDGKPRVRMSWTNDTYRFRDRHEYFAETMSDRYFQSRDIQDAKARSVFAHVRAAFRRMVAALKRLFGRDATGRIFGGFDRREFAPPTPLQQSLRDEMMYAGLDGIRAVRPDAMMAEIRFARAPIAQTALPLTPQATFSAPPESRFDAFLYNVQNKQIDLKRFQDAIKAMGRTIGIGEDAYLAEELYHGRTAKRTQDFINEELRPLLQSMESRGVTMAEMQKFLHARHAKEYNDHVAARDPNRPDGGSGMTTQKAKNILAGYTPEQLQNLSALAIQIDAITRATRRTLVQYGMEPQERIDAWENLFPYYVPLNREDMDTIYGGGAGSGQGYSVRGEFSRPALGSDKDVANIIASIAMQRERAIVRGEKNIVANALIELARRNPNPDIWEFNRPTRIRVLEGGQVVSKVDPNYKSKPNVIVARSVATSGPGAGRAIVERTLTLNPSNPRAARMAMAIKNLDMDDLGHVLGPVAIATRTIAALNTQYNPIFGVTNLARDVQEAAINLSNTPLAGNQAQVVALIPQALRGIYTDLRAARRGNNATNQWGRLWEDFQRLGGQTGFRDLWRTNEDRAKAIEREIKSLTEGKAMRLGRGIFNWLSDYNEAMENSVRLAAFKVALDQGIAPERAASIAKNITVNFNRKGAMTQQVAALYAFFNAAVQGTTRALQTLTSPAGKKIIAGGILIGSMQALMLAAAGFTDEDLPDFVREKNFIIPIGDKRYISIPMPLGFSVLPNIGRLSTEMALDGGKDAHKKAAKMLGIVLNSFNPLGGSGSVTQMIVPTVADPIAAVDANRDWTGRPIARENFSSLDERPGHERAKDTASIWSEYLSRGINRISGGTEHKPGLLSPSPDHIDYLVAQYAGGFVREVNKAIGAAGAAARGDDVPTSKIPLIGRFYGNAEGPNAVRTAYFENIKRLNAHENEVKGRSRPGGAGDVAGYYARHPEAVLWQAANREGNAIANMQKARREMEKMGIERERLREMDRLIAQRMQAFNDLVKSVEARR